MRWPQMMTHGYRIIFTGRADARRNKRLRVAAKANRQGIEPWKLGRIMY